MLQIEINTLHANHDNMFAFQYGEVRSCMEYTIRNGNIKYDQTYSKSNPTFEVKYHVICILTPLPFRIAHKRFFILLIKIL